MPVLTATTSAKSAFSFSYSKLKNYEICPKRYYECDVKKAWPEEPSEQMTWGNAVHKAIAESLTKGVELPATFAMYQPWVDKINRVKGDLLVECKWAITADFKPTAWFNNKVWLRSVADAVKLNDKLGWIVDFKTGKSSNVDVVQLILMSLVAFIQFPKLLCIQSDFIWLQEDDSTSLTIYRDEAADQWVEILPRVKRLERAVIENIWPATPNNFCGRYCSVRSCEYNGRK